LFKNTAESIMKNNKIDRVINIIKENMTATGGGLAGLPPEEPPVDLRKGKRRNWNPFFKNLARVTRRSTKKNV
jgi:hypothetical protein